MKKAFIMFLSLVVMASVGIGSVVAETNTSDPGLNVTNNTVLSPTANATVSNSGNSANINTNTIIVKSTNVNRQIQVQKSATPKTIVVYVKAVPVTNSSAAAGGEQAASGNESGNNTNVPMQSTGFNFVPLLVGVGGLAGGYLASRRWA